MGSVFIRPQGGTYKMRRTVCRICDHSKQTRPVSSYSALQQSPPSNALQRPACAASNVRFEQNSKRALTLAPIVKRPWETTRRFASSSSELNPSLKELRERCEALQQSEKAVPEEDVVVLLQQCLQIVESFVNAKDVQETEKANATSSLLDLEEKTGKTTIPKKEERRTVDIISQLATKLLLDEKVFISPDVLETYSKIQVLLKHADHFPQIFSLYAKKPIPQPNTSPIRFQQQNPKSVKNAIPSDLANSALDVALERKNLSLALAIIDTTFCAPAFWRAKLFKHAAIPIGGLATAPLASYAVASWAATMQNTMDPAMATGIAFTATLAYIGFTSSVGVIAIASSNDQMERVTWAPGVPLRQRWLREGERAALDRVAMAWGFKNPWKRGEEEGEEWESLREFIGMREMILDKTELMEGME